MDKKLTPQQALPKLKQYCAYQERSHAEVKEKLYGYGLNTKDTEKLVAELVTENYLNEERYALAFAGGKFRIKQWGRVKIKYELKQQQVSAYCIKKALASIEETNYLDTLRQLYDKKKATLNTEKNIFIKKKKLHNYLLQKGYESDMIYELLKRDT